MKFTHFALLCGSTLASFEQMKDDVRASINRYVRGLVASGQAQDRNVPAILGSSLDNVNEYGCWCYFQYDHGRGHGKPVNSVDRMCRKLAMGYDCVMLDVIAENGGNDTCVPWEVLYAGGTSSGLDFLVPTCEINRPTGGTCAVGACIVEGYFVVKIVQLFTSGEDLQEDQFKHSNGFDEKKDGSCPLVQGPGESEIECCGEYPHRFPYKTLNGDRGCCEGVAFDASLLDCCQDGVPRLSC